jgi:hypothetical protein
VTVKRMTSTDKVATNRANGRKSTGPRTLAGKRRSRRNALRHGFSAKVVANAACRETVARLALMISGARSGQFEALAREQAIIIAEADALLMRIQATRIAEIGRAMDGRAMAADLTKFHTMLPDLLSYERYERRALSRRRRAIQRLDELRLLESASGLKADFDCPTPQVCEGSVITE